MMSKNKKNLSALKFNAIKLRNNHQLPFFLAYAITKLDKDSDIKVVEYLMKQSDHMLRVKGYYKRYPEIGKKYDELVKSDLSKLGFGL